MAVSTPYPYPAGQVIDPDGHNENVYSKNSGKGIQSEANGGLTSFKTGFEVQKEHIWPEEVVRVRQDAALETIDVFSEAHADSGDVVFRPVAGCSAKVYVPYAATLALWEWSVFISEAHVYLHLVDGALGSAPTKTAAPAMFIRARIIDAAGTVTEISHTQRHLPKTLGLKTGFTGANIYEERACLHFGMHHLQESVAVGWHEISLTLHQDPVTIESTTSETQREQYAGDLKKTLGAEEGTYEHVFYQRASFGIRNARVLTLL